MVEQTRFEGPAVVDGNVQKLEFSGEGLNVVAFFPGAFTPPCTEEMCELRDSMQDFHKLDASVIAVSVDTPFALQEFAKQNQLNFALLSDTGAEIADRYGIKTEFPDLGYSISQRAVFLVEDGEVIYREIMDDPNNLPDFEKLRKEIEKVSA